MNNGRHTNFFFSYDSFKIFMGLPTTGGGPPAGKKETKAAGF